MLNFSFRRLANSTEKRNYCTIDSVKRGKHECRTARFKVQPEASPIGVDTVPVVCPLICINVRDPLQAVARRKTRAGRNRVPRRALRLGFPPEEDHAPRQRVGSNACFPSLLETILPAGGIRLIRRRRTKQRRDAPPAEPRATPRFALFEDLRKLPLEVFTQLQGETRKALWLVREGKVAVSISQPFYANYDVLEHAIGLAPSRSVSMNLFKRLKYHFGKPIDI